MSHYVCNGKQRGVLGKQTPGKGMAQGMHAAYNTVFFLQSGTPHTAVKYTAD